MHTTRDATPKKTRRAEPIETRTARNGTVTYEFRADVGVKPDGKRDRRRLRACPRSLPATNSPV